MIHINHYHQKKERFVHKTKRVALFVIIAATVLWSFFWLPYFRISEILITDPLIQKKEVEKKLGLSLSSFTRFFLPQNNLFLFPSENAEKIILESGLGVAKIEKKFPNKISVDFIEIKPKFLYCKLQECFYIDKDGIPYETAPFFSKSPLPVLELEKELKLGKEFFKKEEASFLLEFQKEIKKLELEIKKIETKNDMKLTTNENWHILLLLGKEKDPKDLAEKLSLLFERKIKDRSKLEYIDMRFSNKAFYKLK